ncbi:CidA/LrgA family protein [Lactococcus nasutitermitis]|uniref:CidA/LrgA family protein n=1 Tax=Lactococcus nasutitermitis TaxID=1652957 RepID=A0ABV9JA47_9LACT|nr:CidA/LrgA family protein [Lactococcus nasutitermitis]
MKIYMQLLFILLFSFIGEIISDGLHLPVPGPIIGMLLLFLSLQFKILEFRHVDEVGSFLINNMTILFLPAGVGIMAKWSLISHFWLQILVIVLVALIVNMLVLGKLMQFIKVKFEGDYTAPELQKKEED